MGTQSTIDFGRPGRGRFTAPFEPGERCGATPISQVAFDDGMEFIDALVEGRGAAGELVVVTRAARPRCMSLVIRIDGRVELVLTAVAQHVRRRPEPGEMSIGVQLERRDGDQVRTLRRVLRSCSQRGVGLIERC